MAPKSSPKDTDKATQTTSLFEVAQRYENNYLKLHTGMCLAWL